MAGSLAAHALVLAVLALPHMEVFPDRSNDEDALTVTLERPRRPTQPAATSEVTPVAATPSPTQPRTPQTAVPSTVEPLPVARPTVVGTGPVPAPQPEGPRGDLRSALRAGGFNCANRAAVGLNRREIERCNERWGEVARTAPVYANAPASADAAAQMARQAAGQDAYRAYKTGPIAPGVDHRDHGGPGKPLDIPFVLGAQQNGEGRPVSELGQKIKRLDDAAKAEQLRKKAAREREW